MDPYTVPLSFLFWNVWHPKGLYYQNSSFGNSGFLGSPSFLFGIPRDALGYLLFPFGGPRDLIDLVERLTSTAIVNLLDSFDLLSILWHMGKRCSSWSAKHPRGPLSLSGLHSGNH